MSEIVWDQPLLVKPQPDPWHTKEQTGDQLRPSQTTSAQQIHEPNKQYSSKPLGYCLKIFVKKKKISDQAQGQ